METILVVDDERIVLQTLATILERAGYDVLGAVGGSEAMAICQQRQQPVDLILTDLLMPGTGGPELGQSLKAMWPGVRLVYTSGYPRDMLAARGITLDQDCDFLAKPFTPKMLTMKVREVLDRARVMGRSSGHGA